MTKIRAEIGTSGTYGTVTLTSDPNEDLAEAVAWEHPCEDSSCDIREANQNGFGAVAAFLLEGATECPLVAAVADAHGFNLSEVPHSPQWEQWMEHFRKYGRECHACGAFTFADDTWEPERCENCLAPLDTAETAD